MTGLALPFNPGRRLTYGGAPEGVDAMALAAAASGDGRPILHVSRDEPRMAALAGEIAFFAPALEVVEVPAWDCLPYDRASPNPSVVSRRMAAFARLSGDSKPPLVLTTISAVLQRVPPAGMLRDSVRRLAPGMRLDLNELAAFLEANGYHRAETVREHGEYALRGGIADAFPSGLAEPVRIDLFGDEIEDIRRFDPLSQRTTGKEEALILAPVSEFLLDDASRARFRTGYRALFGAVVAEDPLYRAVTEGRRMSGMEHWLPLFHESLQTLPDYLPGAAIVLEHQTNEAAQARIEQIAEYHEARRSLLEADKPGRRDEEAVDAVYRPLPPDRLYLTSGEWSDIVAGRPGGAFSPFSAAETDANVVDLGGRRATGFAEARAKTESNVFDAVTADIERARKAGRRVLLAAYSAGSRDRVMHVLAEHGLKDLAAAEGWEEAKAPAPNLAAAVVLELETGFETLDLHVLTEQDILGDRLARANRKRRKAEDFITELSTLATGDLVVHVDHGIGRYMGLETLEIGGAPHDCVRLRYGGDDKLFVPVENIEVLSRFGSEDSGVQLDRLGGAGWQARKARVKERILAIAHDLIKVAAARHLRSAPIAQPPGGLFDEFAARFPFPETEDQERAIAETLADLAAGRPMDRLVCGDVGFGKTEVALRAAFAVAMSGMQVAVVVPTTLLSRQHHKTFAERFSGLPVKVEQLSRFVPAAKAKAVREGMADGTVDIVVGTHALLAKSVRFARLGLVVVDEEQHFGVQQKERLKQLRHDVHVLTLTATPIPRTLQLAMTGVRDLSMIATPPVDRLAVRTFILPYDPVVVREAILREGYRGGQVFYVCPRIEDLRRVRQRLTELVPEARVATVHGQMAPAELEDVMSAFYDGAFDILLSTNIIESGLDIPTANTMIIHRADMFGLAQLYQLRGRIGRSKVRAYAYLTLPPGKMLKPNAQRRLEVMQTLDNLGAGFSLASHDLDIRGAGNLLGQEQSGHVKEVGIELYQQMLQETVATLQADPDSIGENMGEGADWSPQITLGTPVMIPETYIADLGVRMGLYRRLAAIKAEAEIDGFAAEMIDRFGALPSEVENLLRIVEIKALCRRAGIERVDAGPKGATLSFRQDSFANPAGLVEFIGANMGTAKLRPDHKLVYRRDWFDSEARIKGLRFVLKKIAAIAEAAPAAAQ
jgi:transcription-repair coupling factor (superfamily II helicase)